MLLLTDFEFIEPITGVTWIVKDGRNYIRDENNQLVPVIYSSVTPYDYEVKIDGRIPKKN